MKEYEQLRQRYEGPTQPAEELKVDAKVVPIKLLTISCPGLLGDFKQKKSYFGGLRGVINVLEEDNGRDSELQLEGCFTDIANVNKFVKAYDGTIHKAFYTWKFDVKISSGSIIDCFVTPSEVLKRIDIVFDEALSPDSQDAHYNTVFLYFTGHGTNKGLKLYDGDLNYDKIFSKIIYRIKKSKGKNIVVQLVIDACKSGVAAEMFRGNSKLKNDFQKVAKKQ